MPLTPIDVQQKTFATALRGYDLDEVDDFLDAVVVALKDYDQRLADAQERISTLEAEVNDKGDAEGAIARALVAAQRSADAIIADAKEQAQRIVADADSEANELAESRDAERRRLQAEIEDLRSKVSSVRSRVAELTAAIPVTLDEIDQVLDAGAEETSGATFDAAVPVGGYEITPEPQDQADSESSDAEGHHAAEAESDREPGEIDTEEGFGERARHVTPNEASELPGVEQLSQRIDSAFDDIVAEAEDVSESAQRPWEDS